ncbi:hypothetical protein KQV32_02770 [Pseudomonas aeruginosa]|uniref:hypothetical protein n=1 Tax=Pseudomonas aeruginosa TaxID=287 RepID=UPI001C1E093D|nr:hypothetical protein [Pseudomonas aeruginosa]MBU5955498.1 hypothetical protein [Pseudomonas aeruginosa]
MSELDISALDFPELKRLCPTRPRSFKALLYKGAAKLPTREINRHIAEGKLGRPISSRAPLALALHDKLEGDLAAGGSIETAINRIYLIRKLFEFIDESELNITIENSIECLAAWGTHLVESTRRGRKNYTAYSMAIQVTAVFSEIINRPSLDLIRTMGIKRNRARKEILGKQADKQNLSYTYSFGFMLADYSCQLTHEAIFGELPVVVKLRSGRTIEEWSRRPANKIRTVFRQEDYVPYAERGESQGLKIQPFDYTLRTRWPLVNLRVEVEILIFMSQTSMNVSQALKLKIGKFSYTSHIDGYKVSRQYKDRRQGDVEFEIFSEYRIIFERYLQWRNKVFANSGNDLLFPFLLNNKPSYALSRDWQAVKGRCKKLGEQFISPQTLRNTRINWFLRSSMDPELASTMSQHSVRMLLTVYEQPSYQRTMVEVSRFHAQMNRMISAGPGACYKQYPITMSNACDLAPRPDCKSPAGCLFCEHNRDIDSADHVWSLLSFRYLKSLEISGYRPRSTQSNDQHSNAAHQVIKQISLKIRWFKQSSAERNSWVVEAGEKIKEGEYHPRWDGFIQLAEVST